MKRVKFEIDKWGVYITPLIGVNWNRNEKNFWFGWLWFLWTVNLSKEGK